MRRLFRTYHRQFNFEIKQPKRLILEYISHQKNRQKSFLDMLTAFPLDFSQVSIKGDYLIEITIPTTGRIVISLNNNQDRLSTRIDAEIIPYYKGNICGLYFLTFFLSLLSTIGLILHTNWLTVAAILCSWAVFMIIFHLRIVWNRDQLREKLEAFVRDIRLQTGKTKSSYKSS
ncbi:hypothetical protein [Rufibacter aurantiacus]|uniref:hypothetical protein n=1 Tax=Rufibacter aurantiacus TaxID=2817374 RepID=UPI001B313057|nr:hypothetical protein [Rufibacter aurantiacus]